MAESLQNEAHWPPSVNREETLLPMNRVALSLTAASCTPLLQFPLIFTTVLGESGPTYASVRLSFINIYAGKHFCSYVCRAGPFSKKVLLVVEKAKTFVKG